MADDEKTKEAEAREKSMKQDAKKAAKKEASSKKSQSDEVDPGGRPAEDNDKAREDAVNDVEKKSEGAAKGTGVKKAKGGAKEDERGHTYTMPEGYDPLTDPIIPSSHIAGIVKKELESLGESPTLKALHDAKKAAEKK